jgi:hypothetical protein
MSESVLFLHMFWCYVILFSREIELGHGNDLCAVRLSSTYRTRAFGIVICLMLCLTCR